MDDRELVDVWQSEFESIGELESFNFSKDDFGRYTSSRTDGRWQGFLVAKRSMPTIELPTPEDMYDLGGTWLGRFWADGFVHNAITAAGYSYRVKNE